jgi:hypothetical protein
MAGDDARPNILYDLSDDPATAVRQIRDAHAFGIDPDAARRTLLGTIEKLLQDDGVRAVVVSRIRAACDSPEARECPKLRGPLGLYLGLFAAVTYSITDVLQDDLLVTARDRLREPAAADCLYEFYGISREKLDMGGAKLWRIGTTSLIFRCQTVRPRDVDGSEEIALKCLLPRYFSVHAILEQTDDYDRKYRISHPSVPDVRFSTTKTIAMTFVEGPTLAEQMADRAVLDHVGRNDLSLDPAQLKELAKQRALDKADIAYIQEVLSVLCEILHDLHERGSHHLDLSPSNVIVTSERPLKLTLIDFGYNFTVVEHVGSSRAISQAALYVAPELRGDPTIDDWRCDAYSLGIILLEMAARRPVGAEDLHHELNRLWQGDEAWDGAIGLARIVEELIDQRPENRLLLMPDTETSHGPYGYLEKLVQQEAEVQALYQERSASGGFGMLRGRALFSLRRNVQVANLLDTKRAIKDPVDDTYRDYPTLGRWAGVSIAVWVFVWVCFVSLTAADLHFYDFPPPVQWLVDTLHPPFRVGDFWGNLAGRSVALTFALTSVTFYVNNFSLISPRRVGSRLGAASDVLLRLSTLGLAVPVLWALLWDPRAWPLCSGFGTLIVVLNNYLTLRLTQHAQAIAVGQFSTVSDAGRAFVNDNYSEWWFLMGCYSVSLIAIGFLLDADVAHDAGLFAVLVCFINYAKMYRLNCVRFSPYVRGWLSHAILTLRRIAVVEGRRTQETAAVDVPPSVPALVTAVLDSGRASA